MALLILLQYIYQKILSKLLTILLISNIIIKEELDEYLEFLIEGDSTLGELKQKMQEYVENIVSNYSVKILDDCFIEIVKEIEKSGIVEKFFSKLATRLRILNQYGKNATTLDPQHFEELKQTDIPLCSMHIETQKNIRILYTFVGNDLIVLLCSFNEREGKRATDYTKPKKIAKQRYQLFIERENIYEKF